MKLFHWPYMVSAKFYSHGDLIVMAETVEEARVKALKFFETTNQSIGYKSMDWLRNDSLVDQEGKDEYEEFKLLFIEDISKEPNLVHCDVVLVNGGE